MRSSPELEALGVELTAEDTPYVIEKEARVAYERVLAGADAVVGINTTAFLEATILGTPALAITDPRFRHAQEDTVHFRQLLEAEVLHSALPLDEHIESLVTLLREPGAGTERREAGLRAMVRPRGLDLAVGPQLVRLVVALADRRPTHTPSSRWFGGLATGLGFLATADSRVRWRRDHRPGAPSRRAGTR